MKALDVNILIYAHRGDQEHHEYYAGRLQNLLESGEGVGISPAVASGFVRIVTNQKFINGPTPLPVAISFIDTLMMIPQCGWLSPGPRHWSLVSDLCRNTQSSGKLVADADHAATAIEHAATWVSRDSDFTRFVPLGLRFERWDPSE